jgi:hypothetical protein
MDSLLEQHCSCILPLAAPAVCLVAALHLQLLCQVVLFSGSSSRTLTCPAASLLTHPPPPGSALLVPFLICPALAAVVSVGVVQRQFVQDTYLPCCITLDTPPPPPTLLVHFLICPAAVLSVGDVQWQLTQGTHTMRSTSDSGEPTFIFSSVLDRDPDTFYCVILKRGRCCQLPGLCVCVGGEGAVLQGSGGHADNQLTPPPPTHTHTTHIQQRGRQGV